MKFFLTQLDQQVEAYTNQTFTLYTDGTAYFVHISGESQPQGPFAAHHLVGGRFETAVGTGHLIARPAGRIW